MIIFKDKITDCELLTDAYPIDDKDGIFKVKCKLTSETEDVKLAGSNPSAEEGGDDYAPDTKSGLNVVLANGLVESQLDKKNYLACIKAYIKKLEAVLKENNPDRVAGFKKEVENFVKGTVVGKWKEMKWEFYQGKDHFNADGDEGMIVLCSWDEDTDTPYLYYFKDGLEAEKV